MIPSRPVRVLRIIDRLNVGGPAKHVVWLSSGLDPAEFETRLVTGHVAEGEGDMAYFARDAGIEPVVIDRMRRELSLADVAVVAELVRLMWRFRPDVVHTHKSKAGAVGRIAAFVYKWSTPHALLGKPRRCRVVHTFHGHTFHGYFGPLKGRLFLMLERLLARLATDRIVVVSAQQRDEIGRRFRVGRDEQFREIPLGIDLAEVSTPSRGLRVELGFAATDVLVGIVGRLCAIKNHDLFLRGIRRLLERRGSIHGVRFLVIGDGELRSDLEREAARLAIADRVVFMGFRRDATRLYSDLDLVVLTSRNEGTPVTLIEALSAGCPVVSTEVGGVVDLLGARHATENEITRWDHGWTVRSEDADALGAALETLIAAPDLRREMGERGRAFVRAFLSKDRLLRDVRALYRELTDHSGGIAVKRPVAASPEPHARGASPRSAPTSLRP